MKASLLEAGTASNSVANSDRTGSRKIAYLPAAEEFYKDAFTLLESWLEEGNNPQKEEEIWALFTEKYGPFYKPDLQQIIPEMLEEICKN